MQALHASDKQEWVRIISGVVSTYSTGSLSWLDPKERVQVHNEVTDALADFPALLRWAYMAPEKGRQLEPEFHQFLKSPEFVQRADEVARRKAEAKVVAWLGKLPEPEAKGQHPDLEAAVSIGETSSGTPILGVCLSYAVGTGRVGFIPDTVNQMLARVRTHGDVGPPSLQRLLLCLAEQNASRSSSEFVALGSIGHLVPVQSLHAFLAAAAESPGLKWMDGAPFEGCHEAANLEFDFDGSLKAHVLLPRVIADPPARIDLADVQVAATTTTLGAELCFRYLNRVVPLNAGRVPRDVIQALRRAGGIPASTLQTATVPLRALSRLPTPADKPLAQSMTRVLPVAVTASFFLEGDTLRVGLLAKSREGHCWQRAQNGWLRVQLKKSGDAPGAGVDVIDEDRGIEVEDKTLPDADGQGVLLSPRGSDLRDIDRWLQEHMASSPAFWEIAVPGQPGCTWPLASTKARHQFLKAWIDRPSRPTYMGNQAFRDLLRLQPLPKLKLDFKSTGVSWLEASARMEGELSSVNLKQLREALSRSDDAILLLPGAVLCRREDVEELDRSLAVASALGVIPGRQARRMHAMQLSADESHELFESVGDVAALQEFSRAVRRCVKTFQGVPPADVPAAVAGFLRPYQRAGVDFLAWSASTFGGALLADDMGLGKTLQVLATLAALRGGIPPEKRKPCLVICPASVVYNWEREAGRFQTGFKVLVTRSGAARGRALEGAGDYDLVVTNYALARRDYKQLANIDWHVIVLDEAQAIKNRQSETATVVKGLEARHRLALTGTPIENRLDDILSILEFTNPGYMPDLSTLDEGTLDRSLRYKAVRARLRPVMIRRLKEEVAPELPERIEEERDCELTASQREAYIAELARARGLLDQAPEEEGVVGPARIQLLAALTRLREICCHPRLLGHAAESGKFEELFALLPGILEAGHKVLVFSQFVRMLELIEDRLKEEEIPYFLLTGQTTNRQELVERFENDPTPSVFLLSIKAGGVGLNLVSASHVIIYDPWWNPAVEAQAIDRTHRIGQDKTVVALRLVTRETIEERIVELKEKKKGIVANVLDDESFNRTLTRDDFRFLFSKEGG